MGRTERSLESLASRAGMWFGDDSIQPPILMEYCYSPHGVERYTTPLAVLERDDPLEDKANCGSF